MVHGGYWIAIWDIGVVSMLHMLSKIREGAMDTSTIAVPLLAGISTIRSSACLDRSSRVCRNANFMGLGLA